MDRTRIDAETHAAGGEATSHIHMRSGPADGDDRPTGLLGGLASRARGALGDRFPATSLLDAVRERPLTAVGIVFSAGFLLAVSTGTRRKPAILDRARSRIRAVLLTGLTAAIAQELRSIVSDEDLADLFAAWTGHEDEVELGEDEL